MTTTSSGSTAGVSPVAPSAQTRRRGPSRDSRLVLLMLSPGLVLVILFFGFPVVDLVRSSLSNWSGVGNRVFIGSGNYSALLSDGAVQAALARSVLLGLGTAIGIGIIATLLAALVS